MYQGGILDSDKCGTMVDHGVLAVGYGTDPTLKMEYFILRNSWGSSWGDKGYIRLAAKDGAGVCGMNQIAAFPTVKMVTEEPQSEPKEPKEEEEDTSCFEWNRQMWFGTKPTNPVYTRCGLEKCIDCLTKQECFEWNYKMWAGSAPSSHANASNTACGHDECIPCPNGQ